MSCTPSCYIINCCAPPRLGFPLSTRRRDSLSVSNTHPKSHSRPARASALHLAQHHVHFGVKHCISSGFSLGQPCWGFSWLYVRWDLRQGRMEETLPSKPYCHPAPASAPLRHCPTKSSAAVIAGKKKKHEPCMQAAALRVMTAGLWICTGITLNYYLH